jgi:DNA-binding GntR family transcriptional regulator
VRGFEHLEILLLFYGARSAEWSIESVSERTGISSDVVARTLSELESSELIRRDTRNRAAFRFGPRLPEAMDAIEALAALYCEQRAAIMSRMSVNAIERIRSGTIRAFADSFVLKKKNRSDDHG